MSFSKAVYSLLVWMVTCAVVASCRSLDSQAVAEKKELQSVRRILSKGEMIAVATAAASQYDHDPNEWEPVIDGGNAAWRRFVLRGHYQPRFEDSHAVWPVVNDDELDAVIVKDFPMLKDRDYQALWYRDLSPGPFFDLDAKLCILIDRNTGEILAAVDRRGVVLKPKLDKR